MAFTASAIFRQTIADTFAGTSVFDLNAPTDVYKVALYNNTGTPDKDATAALSCYAAATSAWVVGNEVSQAVTWPAGGVALANMVIRTDVGSGIIMFDANDTPSAASATLSNVYGSLIYNDTKTAPADQGVCYNYFGGANSVTSGVLTVVWNANGIFRITV